MFRFVILAAIIFMIYQSVQMAGDYNFQETNTNATHNSKILDMPFERNGTGFYINNQGHIITNEHVVRKCTEVRITNESTGESSMAQVLATKREVDLAVLATENKSNYLPRITASMVSTQKDENSYVYGCPDILDEAAKQPCYFKPATIVGVEQYEGSATWIVLKSGVTDGIRSGYSGSAIIHPADGLIGVVSRVTESLFVAAKYDTSKVDQGIRLELLLEFLAENNIPHQQSDDNNYYDADEIERRAQDFTVSIYCDPEPDKSNALSTQ